MTSADRRVRVCECGSRLASHQYGVIFGRINIVLPEKDQWAVFMDGHVLVTTQQTGGIPNTLLCVPVTTYRFNYLFELRVFLECNALCLEGLDHSQLCLPEFQTDTTESDG